jgi:hypothetical protein
MAAHGHDSAAHAHDAHDDFDPEPATELSPGEPKSPSWLPLLGVGLFLAGGIWFLARGGDEKNGAAPSASASVSAAAAPVKAPPATPARPAVTGGTRAPGGASNAPPEMLDREKQKKLQEMLRERRGAGSAAPGAPPARQP